MADTVDLTNDAPQAEPMDETLFSKIAELEQDIRQFKKELYTVEIGTDQSHNADDLGAMYQYHGLLLQSVAFWISLLDSVQVPKPVLPGDLEPVFQSITDRVLALHASGTDGRTLTYNVLYKVSTEHPFYFLNNNQEFE